MKEITIKVTEEQEKFLKAFALKQYPGAKDNVCTVHPVHVVENTRYNYVPFHEDIADYYDPDKLAFSYDEERNCWYYDEKELVEEYMNNYGELYIPIVPFEDMRGKEMKDVHGEIIEVEEFVDYFKVYGIKNVAAAWREPYYEPAAFFLVREEAEKYMKYQRHNLTKPRIFSHAAGYDNRGDLPHFMDFILKVGQALNKEEGENE